MYRLALPFSTQMELMVGVTAQYTEPHRHFHTLKHLQSLFSIMNEFSLGAHVDTDLLTWVILFHDWFYDPASKDNETKSAAYAQKWMMEKGQVDYTSVSDIILATQTHTHIDVINESSFHKALFLDMDLSGLGSSWECYSITSEQVAQEYVPFVGYSTYRVGRERWIRDMLARPRIYNLDWFHDRFETQAQNNLYGELANLVGEE